MSEKSKQGVYATRQSISVTKTSCVYCDARLGSFKCYLDRLQVLKEEDKRMTTFIFYRTL